MGNNVKFMAGDARLSPQELNTLFHECGCDDYRKHSVEKTTDMLKASTYFITARLSKQLVGFGRLFGDPYIAMISDVIAHPDVRTHGIASMIVTQLMQHARENYAKVMVVDESNVVGFYEHFGFVPVSSDTARLLVWTRQM